MKFQLPKTFIPSKRSPSIKELEKLHDFLNNNYNGKIKNILEFGCGITSLVLNQALSCKNHLAIEQFEPCINDVKYHIKNIKILPLWEMIPNEKYDLIFVDASTGPPKGLKPIHKENKRPFRDDAIHYARKNMKDSTIVIIHDWCHKNPVWRLPRVYLENNNFKCIWSCPIGYGFGAYRYD